MMSLCECFAVSNALFIMMFPQLEFLEDFVDTSEHCVNVHVFQAKDFPEMICNITCIRGIRHFENSFEILNMFVLG
jgi:hypothetical protein